jgi:hypothetical protein
VTNKKQIGFVNCIAFFAFASITSHASETYQCPDAAYAKTAFETEEIKQWPNFSVGPATRVQLQHLDTAIIAAQAKFIQSEKGNFAVCQYYTHIGLLITTGFFVKEKGTIVGSAYWRSEYRESAPEQDKKGEEMMDVCMEKKDGLSFPSVDCKFVLLGD